MDRTAEIRQDLAASKTSEIKFHRNERNIGAAADYNKLFHPLVGVVFPLAERR